MSLPPLTRAALRRACAASTSSYQTAPQPPDVALPPGFDIWDGWIWGHGVNVRVPFTIQMRLETASGAASLIRFRCKNARAFAWVYDKHVFDISKGGAQRLAARLATYGLRVNGSPSACRFLWRVFVLAIERAGGAKTVQKAELDALFAMGVTLPEGVALVGEGV